MYLDYKRHFLLLAACLVTFSATYAQRRAQHRTYRLTEADTAKTLVVKTGSMIRLTLPDRVDGGYRFDTIKYNHSVLQLKSFRQTAPAAGSPAGAAGTGAWRFIAVRKGATNIILTATRPWKGGGTVTVFENKVKVK